MGDLSQIDLPAQIGLPARIPLILSTPAHLMDHRFLGRPVFPAVEAMEALAVAARQANPRLRVDRITDARFEKFLFIDPAADRIEAAAELQHLEKGSLQAVLLTRAKDPKTAFTRTKIHARLNFDPSSPGQPQYPLDMAAALEGVCTLLSPESIYRDLVPFGPAYQNVGDPLFVSPDGAIARIETPLRQGNAPGESPLLGSPFALDAAMHAACVWAQRYRGIVAFPVGLDRRTVIHRTSPGKVYFGRVKPKNISDDLVSFDILLMDETGRLCEAVEGVRMRDVSGGRLQPPDWIRQEDRPDSLEPLRSACLAITIVELDAVAPFAPECLTPLEREGFQRVEAQQRRGYLAARLALKRLYRCRGEDASAPADRIETVCEDSPRPRIGRSTSGAEYHCSVSHDRRFAVAAADTQRLGVDVEVISDKARRSCRLFISASEQMLIRQSPMDEGSAAFRIRSIKEAAARATGMNLAEAWSRVRVTTLGADRSCLSVDQTEMRARHASIADHLFTLVSAPPDRRF